jgi:Recombination endonuclease VII
MGAWTGKACAGCGKKKGPNQANLKYCWTCGRAQKASQSKAAHGKRVEQTYGISEEDYWALYEFQGGRCAICRWAQGKKKRLAVDHDHSCLSGHAPDVGCSDCVRGLLCTFCNRLIGKFRDSVEVFQRAIAYLTTPPWKQLQELRRGKVS